MAANMNENKTFSGVISFEEMNFSKSTTENIICSFSFEDEEKKQIYMIHKEIYRNYWIQSLQHFFHPVITGSHS